MAKKYETILKLKVTEALTKDVGRVFSRMGPEDLDRLGIAIGDTMEVSAKRSTVCAAGTKGLSGAQIESVCNKAALGAIRRVFEGLKEIPSHELDILIEVEDMETALAEVKSV